MTDASEQVSDLVRIHARSRHLDRTCPVKVVMAQIKGEALNLQLGQSRLIQRHKEVRGTHAALSTLDWHEEKVELPLRVLGFLDQVTVNDAAAGWIAEAVFAVEDEEGLDDPLVDDQECDLGTSGGLIVNLVEGCLELNDFTVYDLSAFSRTDTVSIDDDVGRVVVHVVPRENVNGSLDAAFELGCDDFLALGLHDEV